MVTAPQIRKLPPLETPLNYPECLNRIVEAGEIRADFEINQGFIVELFKRELDKPLEVSDYWFK